MKVTEKGIELDKSAFEKASIALPMYSVSEVRRRTCEHPLWVHMGAGNIYHAFIASVQQDLLNRKLSDRGIVTLSTRSGETREKIEKPHDNLVLGVTLLPDSSTKMQVIGATVCDLLLNGEDKADEARAVEMFKDKSLQLMSFTITEKGYSLKGIDGSFTPVVLEDFKNGPKSAKHGMSITCALLYERYLAGKYPISLVSMDNCSNNGTILQHSVVTIAEKWVENGFCEKGFLDYLKDENTVAFPCSMIDKITPRPDPDIEKMLKDLGVEDMESIKTSKGTYIAPFVNAEKPQYLVIEDRFPNGRPPLEKAGVLFTTKKGVELCERMKVTTCLNPLHTALAVYGCVLGYKKIADEMDDRELVSLVKKLGYDEGLKVVEDPKILNPEAFLSEVIEQRLVNRALPDTPQRIATDTSQKVPVRFGETLKSYIRLGLDTSKLVALPLAIAGWLRYLLGIDDNGKEFVLSDDPQLETLKKYLEGITLGSDADISLKVRPILSNKVIFGVDLYEAGVGEKIEKIFREEIASVGAVRNTLKKYLG
ncbi:mannitol dehydrogenase family protein [uncultured Succinivibrio sp.]|uniref:mannitol dehydrogenase family protein n=1 Tax=uncultured Succinivibrio sp. TaxID=540749 RepID=UPI0025F0140E|nr:mannitol dehydrogenase family protein [uncultured Succinivibrio sp.]